MSFKPLFSSRKTPFLVFSLLSLIITGCSVDLEKVEPKPIEAGNIKPKDSLSDNVLKKWWQLDINKDSIPGASIERAYNEILKYTVGTPVTVAVIDAGLDINHEDLKTILWKNPKEIPGNNKDDDGNGYIDDVHGWNFLGKNNSLKNASTRIVKALMKKYKDVDPASVPEKDKAEYNMYIKAKEEYDKLYEDINTPLQEEIEGLKKTETAHKAIAKALKKENYTKKEVAAIKDTNLASYVKTISAIFANGGNPISAIKEYKNIIAGYKKQLQAIDLNSDNRPTGDDPNNINDSKYGNGILFGKKVEESFHGTHVAGIISALRNNGKGINGVTNDVRIMAIRAVPTGNGDEHDKDIALAIRYAVDNGAKVINMSFGKSFSAKLQWVKDAIKYAEEKDVLLVSAAGNSSEDTDITPMFPNDQDINGTEYVNNFIVVGNTTHIFNEKLVAGSSNYGKTRVDIFAPGSKILSTMPKNKYDYDTGTSMAAPVVSGIAAVIRSLYPSLKASQVKDIILDSGITVNLKVKKPGGGFGGDEVPGEDEISGGDEEVDTTGIATNSTNDSIDNDKNLVQFSELSKSGKIVNLYNALLMAKSR